MRVLLLTHSYAPESSPPQRRWGAFIQRFREAGWDVDVVAPVAHYPFGRRRLPVEQAGRPWRSQTGRFGERIKRVPYLRHGDSKLGRFVDQFLSAVLSVPAGLAVPRPDVVVATAPSLPTLATGYVLARLRRVPLIVEMRDAWPDLAQDARVVEGGVKTVVERVIRFIQERADLVVAVTEGFAATLTERGVKRVAVISNGVEAADIRPLEPPPLEPPPGQRERLIALYLGNHGESQRLDVVIRASAMVGDRMLLRLAGHGTKRAELMRLAAELGAPVEFLPQVNRDEVRRLYQDADTCVISLRDDWKSFDTTVPSKTYEVLATGRHVTGIVRGEARKILLDARAGDVVPARPEAIAALWKDLADNRSRLAVGSHGRQWVLQHADYPLLAGQYMELITSLVTERNPA